MLGMGRWLNTGYPVVSPYPPRIGVLGRLRQTGVPGGGRYARKPVHPNLGTRLPPHSCQAGCHWKPPASAEHVTNFALAVSLALA